MAFYCRCGLKFRKDYHYKNHIKICSHHIKTDGSYEITVLGDKLFGWKITRYDLLYRCPKQRKFQLKHLLQMEKNTSFLDIGANFGDTVCTFAIYAKNNNRKDINFFAFEPNKNKCDYIKYISKINDLNITIFNNCISNNNINCSLSNNHLGGTAAYKIDPDGNFKSIKLDDIKNIIEPVGYMHIDVEGWEAEVLNGANDILKNNKMKIFAEYWNKDNELKILKELKNINYKRLEDFVENGEKNIILNVNMN